MSKKQIYQIDLTPDYCTAVVMRCRALLVVTRCCASDLTHSNNPVFVIRLETCAPHVIYGPMRKLHRFLDREAGITRAALPGLLRQHRVLVDGSPVTDADFPVNRFHRIEVDQRTVQAGERALYIMLHKPVGVVSATIDAEHPTVVSLINDPDRDKLHLAGRLDRSTSGLVLLTNDGTWSKCITAADHQVAKVYHVTTEHPISPETVFAFAAGFYFHTEDITTLPADLEILSSNTALLTLREGRYHQIKRMFHRVQNRVVALHRERIGGLELPVNLPPGGWRFLTKDERHAVIQSPF